MLKNSNRLIGIIAILFVVIAGVYLVDVFTRPRIHLHGRLRPAWGISPEISDDLKIEQGDSITIPMRITSFVDRPLNIQLTLSIFTPEEVKAMIRTDLPPVNEFPSNPSRISNITVASWNQTDVYRYEFVISNITLQPYESIQTKVTIFIMEDAPIGTYRLSLGGKANELWESWEEFTSALGPESRIGGETWHIYILR